MLIMWFAKDGLRPESQSGPGIDISNAESEIIIGGRALIFSGEEAPSINPEQPSYSVKNVIIEVRKKSECSAQLSKVGFYVISGLSPSEAAVILSTCRS